jgi:hypothetical protein
MSPRVRTASDAWSNRAPCRGEHLLVGCGEGGAVDVGARLIVDCSATLCTLSSIPFNRTDRTERYGHLEPGGHADASAPAAVLSPTLAALSSDIS